MNVSNRIIHKATAPSNVTTDDEDPMTGWELLDSIPKGMAQTSANKEADTSEASAVFAEREPRTV